ncbi:hypothetical protein E2C01_068440 [Portunus trituberculatus]|uniref:Uncharacterized protein n=1 Tax=Portunus trituberculatus TaxID=210409 RepID=A0A5B7I026_PORTR|nr:hypothetical protein [Portunus trituberculatus]
MFETVKAHPTFNYSKGFVYSQDLYEFHEEEILDMCPNSVQKVNKIKNSSNMVLLTFFGSILPDRVLIGPINLRSFSCYGYGHGKNSCKETSRCVNCSALDSHSEEHCNAAAYCFHCRDDHQVRSRYRLEQDILQPANSRRELLYRQKDGTGATSYSSLAARSSGESAGQKITVSAIYRSVGASGPVHLANGFSLLSDDSVESSLRSDKNSTDLTKFTHIVDVHLPPVSPKPLKGLTKRHRGSAESINLAQPKQSKVSPGIRDRESSRDSSGMVAPVVSVQPSVTPFVSDRASCDEDYLSMETFDDIDTAVPRESTVSESAVLPDLRPPKTGKCNDGSQHPPRGRVAAVQRPGTSQLLVSHGQPL